MYERILVPLDGSDRAEEALAHARELAQRFQSEMLLLWVVAHEAGGDDSASPAGRYLEEQCARLRSAGLTARPLLRVSDDAGDTILQTAQGEDVSLICMATHGLGGIRRLVLGSVADEIVRRAEVPVLLVRPTAEP